MRRGVLIVSVVVIFGSCSWAQNPRPVPEPDAFVIGRHTFFDFGPPNNYYDLIFVTETAQGASVQRVTLIPGADACSLPAKMEVASAMISQPVSDLLGGVNPCGISDRELRRELKRCKKCLVFSYAETAMQVQCSGQIRVIRSEILDRDMFDPQRAATPKNTSWTMQLLSRLDETVGPGVMDKPMFGAWDESQSSPRVQDSSAFQDIGTGKYDALFPEAPDKLSVLYTAAQKPMPVPTVRLVSVGPFAPQSAVLPTYPGIARLAHLEGSVTLNFYIGTDGRPTGIVFESGPGVLQRAVTDAVSSWSFQHARSLQKVTATMEFKLNCPIQKK
jgi:TonB family protein